MKDKSGTILKIGDRVVEDKTGMVFVLENIRGVSMGVARDKNRRIIKTVILRKMDFMKMEKVV